MDLAPIQQGLSSISLPLTCSTASCNSTVHGIGTVTGRVIMSVGELALKGVVVIKIQRSLSSIHSALVISEGKAPLDDKMCNALLELSRHGLYPDRIRRKAWGLILLMIAARNTRKLIECLLGWPDVDIKWFLVDLSKVVPRGWIFLTLGDPLPVSREALHLQGANSCLPMHLVHFLHSLQDASAKKDWAENLLDDSPASIFSFASFVSSSGQMTLGPNVFLHNLNVYVGHVAITSLVKYYMCARLNRISTLFRTSTGYGSVTKESIGLHSEVLEIYRLFSHDRGVQKQTKELLFISISRFHAVSLVLALTQWSPEQLHLFIILVMRWTLSFVKPTLSMDDTTLPKAYRVHLATHSTGRHPVLPFLCFFTQLALDNKMAAEMLLELNIISILKTMCINNYPNPAAFMAPPPGNRIAISDVCAMSMMLIGALSIHPTSCRSILRLRDFPRWFLSFYYNSEFLGIPDAPLLQSVWMKLETPLLKFVLACVEHVLKDEDLQTNPEEADYLPLEQIYRDIIDVLRDPLSEPEMLQSASDSLFRCIVLQGEYTNVLDATFANDRAEETISVLYTASVSAGERPDKPQHTPRETDLPPFPPPGSSLREVKSYVNKWAHRYTDDSRTYSSLVADLIGSQACNAHYSLIERFSVTPRLLLTMDTGSSDSHGSTDSSQPIYSIETVELTSS